MRPFDTFEPFFPRLPVLHVRPHPHPRPHGLDPPARQAAGRHRRPADDRARRRARARGGLGRVVVATDAAEPSPMPCARRLRGGDDRRDHPSGLRPHLRGAAGARPGPAGSRPSSTCRATCRRSSPPHPRRCSRRSTTPPVDIATLGVEIVRDEETANPNVVKVVGSPVADRGSRALYFTRATAPWGDGPLYHHIGLYAYRRARWSASSRCRLRRWSGARGWSSCGRWKPACASTSRSSARCRSASTRRTTSSARAQFWPIDKDSTNASRKDQRISFQGEPGANSDTACRNMYPGMEPLPCPTFEDAFDAVETGKADLAMIPIENTDRRPRRRHPSPAAGIEAAHHRRIFPADPLPADGAAGRRAQGDQDASTATSMRSASAANTSARTAGSRSSPATRPARPSCVAEIGDRTHGRARAAPGGRALRPRHHWRRTSRTPTATSPASSC